jgi:hypothetical protein
LSGRELIPPIKYGLRSLRMPAVRVLTEEQLARRTVMEGLGRALRLVYTEEQVGPPTEGINQMLARLPKKFSSSKSPSNENT